MKTTHTIRLSSLFLLGVLLAGGCRNQPDETADAAEKAEAAIPVRVAAVQASDFGEYGEYYGKVAGLEEKVLISLAGGSVDAIQVKEGDTVTRGQSLGRIDSAKAQTAYDVARLNEKIARQNHALQLQFLKDGITSQVAVDEAELAWMTARSALLEAEKVLAGALCVTPIDGIVVSRFIDLHQEVAPGSPTFAVARMDRVRIAFGIPEQEIAGVAIGNEAEVTFAMHPGRVWKGTLQRIGREVSPETVTFRAEVQVDNSDGTILSGITARVRLRRGLLAKRIVVPSEAILADGEETYVMVAEGNLARKVQVVPGPSDKTRTVILEGLPVGSRLIVEGNHIVADGARVAVTAQE